MSLSGLKEKSLWVYEKILEALLVVVFAFALVFTMVIEFFRHTDFRSLAKSLYSKPFSYLPKNDKPKQK